MKRSEANARVVYSTDPEAVIPPKGKEQLAAMGAAPRSGGAVRVRLEKKGRAGKTVTVASGFKGSAALWKDLAKELKAACGAGGTMKEDAGGIEIEIQGDHVEKVKGLLRVKGFEAR